MLVFAAITPHTPLLIPSIGRENLKALGASVRALARLADEIYAAHAQTIIVLSPHALQHPDAFTVNLHDAYVADFKEFGDLAQNSTYVPDLELVTQIQRHMRAHHIPFTLNSAASLDYGVGVPLASLVHESQMAVIPLAPADLDGREHLRFGAALRDVIDASPRRVAVIASGDLSHALSAQAPLGLRPEGEAYDQTVLEAVKNVSSSILLQMDPSLVERSGQCLFEALLILFGVLERRQVRPEILAYEAPFGVGYLTAQFHLTGLFPNERSWLSRAPVDPTLRRMPTFRGAQQPVQANLISLGNSHPTGV